MHVPPRYPTPSDRRRSVVAVAALALAVTLCTTACRGTEPPGTTASPDAPPAGARPVPSSAVNTRAVAMGNELVVFASHRGGEVVERLPATTPFGSPTVVRVLSIVDDRAQVAVPVRPNGSTGWVDLDSVELEPVAHAVVIDLDARQLVVTADGAEVLRTTVAVGTGEDPTPTGEYFVTDLVRAPDAGGAYGPFAFGLSAYSESRSEFAGGPGQIGIHGTNDPGSIGLAASHGCIRVRNDVAVDLAGLLELGTPVTIVAASATL